jgi:acetyl-CoA C-acetyltransferase
VSVDPRSPCVIGVAQEVWRPSSGDSVAPEPLDMWETVARLAASDCAARAGAGAVLDAVESLRIVYCQSWQYDDPPGRLAARLGIAPRHGFYSGIGGTTPQVLVDDVAESIVAGDLDVALVTGAEALDTVRRLRKAGERPQWSHRDPERKPFPFEAPFHPAEVAHEVFQAWLTFAVWDVARRAHLGVEPAAYQTALGELFAPMTRVAAANPYAWFPRERTAAELATPAPDNRIVGYPYTKYLVSVMDVDMAAALVVASHAAADALGVPPERRVYVRGWRYATDPVYVAEHDPMWASPAMRLTTGTALGAAGVGIDDVTHLDLYSCFPSSVLFALDALGVAVDDSRGVTVTGGLPYSGGAGSDYMTHSIAAVVDVLRHDPGSYGLVTGVGMHMTKHVAAVYSSEPGAAAPDVGPAAVEGAPARPIRSTYTGPATVAAYTVAHGRDGAPEWGLAVCDLPLSSGERAYAKILDPSLLADVEAREWVGATVELVDGGNDVNLVEA